MEKEPCIKSINPSSRKNASIFRSATSQLLPLGDFICTLPGVNITQTKIWFEDLRTRTINSQISNSDEQKRSNVVKLERNSNSLYPLPGMEINLQNMHDMFFEDISGKLNLTPKGACYALRLYMAGSLPMEKNKHPTDAQEAWAYIDKGWNWLQQATDSDLQTITRDSLNAVSTISEEGFSYNKLDDIFVKTFGVFTGTRMIEFNNIRVYKHAELGERIDGTKEARAWFEWLDHAGNRMSIQQEFDSEEAPDPQAA